MNFAIFPLCSAQFCFTPAMSGTYLFRSPQARHTYVTNFVVIPHILLVYLAEFSMAYFVNYFVKIRQDPISPQLKTFQTELDYMHSCYSMFLSHKGCKIYESRLHWAAKRQLLTHRYSESVAVQVTGCRNSCWRYRGWDWTDLGSRCVQKTPNTTLSRIFRGWEGSV